MKKTKMAYDVNETPPLAKWIILAIQHVFAMFGATILVPILVNQAAGAEVLTIPVALVASGIGTLLYILCTKGKSPVYLGSSFAFITPVAAAYMIGGTSGAMTGIMVVGLIYIIVAILIHFIGKDWINKILPPVVIGPMIMIIGLGLAPSAINQTGLKNVDTSALESKLAIVEMLNKEDYSEASWNNLKSAVEGDVALQSEVDAKVGEISSALGELKAPEVKEVVTEKVVKTKKKKTTKKVVTYQTEAVGSEDITRTNIIAGKLPFKEILVAVVSFLVTALVMTRAKGFFKVIPFLIGIASGYILAVCLDLVDFAPVISAGWFSVPKFQFPFIDYKISFAALMTIAPIAIVTMCEHIGDHISLGNIINKDLIKDPGLDRTLLGDGLATLVAGAIGGPANTTYGENTSVVGMTKVASVKVIGLAAIVAIVIGFFGKFTALVGTIPNAVLGGVSLLLYGFIAVNGLKVLIKNQVDFEVPKNVVVASSMLVLGLGGAAISIISGNLSVTVSGMSLAAIVGVILNFLLPDEKVEEEGLAPKIKKIIKK